MASEKRSPIPVSGSILGSYLQGWDCADKPVAFEFMGHCSDASPQYMRRCNSSANHVAQQHWKDLPANTYLRNSHVNLTTPAKGSIPVDNGIPTAGAASTFGPR